MNERKKAINALKSLEVYKPTEQFVKDCLDKCDEDSSNEADNAREYIDACDTLSSYLSNPSFDDAVRCVKDKIEIEEKKISEYRKENDGVHPIIYEAYRNAFQLILTELKGMIK